ncbi:MAG TPA: dihydroorotate dehydrogenase-like protein [Acidobacteriaceae bacterium]
MVDLSTDYLGLKLKSPVVVSSTPLSDSSDNVQRMEDHGAAAVVLSSLFEEQLDLESRALDRNLTRGTESFAEALTYLPDYDEYRATQDAYLAHLVQVKNLVAIPVLASINGVTPSGWVKFAQDVESAGADALELNTYSLAINPTIPGKEIEKQLVELVRRVRQSIKIPLAVKLSPQFTSIPNLAAQLDAAGANSLVLFNRFYQPDFDIEALDVMPRLAFSRSDELLLRLHWIAILYGNVKADLAVTGGVHTADDVVKGIMAGAKVAMIASELHQGGIDQLQEIHDRLTQWMEEHEYASFDTMRGALSRRSIPDASPFERGNYIKTLSSYTLRQ